MLGGVWTYRAFCIEDEKWPYYPKGYLRHNISGAIYFAVMALCVVLSFLFITTRAEKKKSIRMVFSILVVFVQSWFMYAPNFFKDNGGTLFHMDAYTNSIINSLNYAPLEMYSASIYGHYGILYILPVKLLKWLGFNQWVSVTLAIALIGGVTFMLEYWTLSRILENDAVFMLALLASACVSAQIYHGQYYQMMPHRYVFQAVIMSGIVFVGSINEEKKKNIYKAVMWVLAGLAVVWNTETGIVCAFVWMLGNLYIDAEEREAWSLKLVSCGLGKLAATIAGAYVFVNGYNLMVGGHVISFLDFTYPLGSNAYLVDKLQTVLGVPWDIYFFPVAVFLSVLGYYVVKVIKREADRLQLMVVLASVMGLGVFTYYMNRAVTSNATIVNFAIIVVISYAVDKTFRGRMEIAGKISVQRSSALICLVVMVSMALATVASFGVTLQTKNQTTYEVESLDQFVEGIWKRIPEETVAFGVGTAQLFSYMNRNTGIYIADWEDLDGSFNGETPVNQDALDCLVARLENNHYHYILAGRWQAQYLPEGYRIIDRFEYSGYAFDLYEDAAYIPETVLSSNDMIADQINMTISYHDISYDNGTVTCILNVTNTGETIMDLSVGAYPINLGARILDPEGNMVNGDYLRTGIKNGMFKKGEGIEIPLTLNNLEALKDLDYILRFEIVQEGVAWIDSTAVDWDYME